MRIKKLSLTGFKNLQDFEINFDDKSFRSVVIGRNGTGKEILSNVVDRRLSGGVQP